MKKTNNISCRQTILMLVFSFFIIGIAGFQLNQSSPNQFEISPNCYTVSKDSPLEVFKGYNPRICTDDDLENYNSIEFLLKKGNEYKIKKENEYKETWYNDEIASIGNNNWLMSLAIVRPDLDVIYDEENKAIVFGGRFNDKYSVWVWIISSNDRDTPPQEMQLIDLVAGDGSTKELMTILSEKNGGKYEKSKFQTIIKLWVDSGYRDTYKVIAYLPQNCINNNEIGGQQNCLDYANQAKDVFDIDPNKDRPKCINSAIGNETLINSIGLLVKTKSSFEVHTRVSSTSSAEPYEIFESQNNKYIAWLTILCLACKVELDSFEKNGIGFYVYACENYILCIKQDDASIYAPLKLIDENLQQNIVTKIINNPAEYHSSIIKKLVNEWAENPSKKYVIKAIGNPSFYTYNGDNSNLQEYLENTKEEVYTNNVSVLIKELNSGNHYHRNQNGIESYSWYSSISPQDSANIWLAQLAAIDPNVKLLQNQPKNYTFITSIPSDHLRAWNLTQSQFPREFSPLQNLYDKTPNRKFTFDYAKAIREHSEILYDQTLKKIIEEYFDNNAIETKKIRQIYTAENSQIREEEYSPLKVLKINPTNNDNIPSGINEVFDGKTDIQYLVEEHEDFNIYNSQATSIKEKVWFQDVSHFKNPWLAWLCLADNSIKVIVSTLNNENTGKVCLISGKNEKVLWTLKILSQNVPKEYLLIDGNELFEFTNIPIGEYTKLLYDSPDQTSDAEKSFFLDKPEEGDEIKILDFLTYENDLPTRVLMWRRNEANINFFHRVGIRNDFKNDVIKTHLIDKQNNRMSYWEQIAQRYNKDWYKTKFKTHLGRAEEDDLQIWFGEEKLGINKGNQVGVFLHTPNYRDFEFTNFISIQSLANDLTYIPLSERRGTNKPEKDTFFKSWVARDWDKNLWRANPLGFFDRVQYENHINL